MRFVACGRSSPCIVNAHSRSRIVRVEHLARVRDAGRGVDALHDRAARRRRARRCRRGSRGDRARVANARHVVVDDHVVVVQVRDRAAAVAVQAERERADHERLEVVHEVAADEVGRVGDLGAQQQPRRLPRAARDDHDARAHLVRVAVDVEVAHAARAACPTGRAAPARRRTRRGSRSARCAARCAAARPDRPSRRSGSRRTRRTRSCCTRAGRRTGPSSRRSARGTGGSRAASRLRS